MSNHSIRFHKSDYEDPPLLNFFIEAKTPNLCLKAELYDSTESLTEVAQKLQTFPDKEKNTVTWSLGSESKDKNALYYFLFEVALFSLRGETSIHIKYNNNTEKPYQEISDFSIITTPAEVNNLGMLMQSFAKRVCDSFEWSC